MVRDEEGVGSRAEPLKASNVGTEEGSDGDAVRDGDVDDVDGDCAVGGWNIWSGHVVAAVCRVFTSTSGQDDSSWCPSRRSLAYIVTLGVVFSDCRIVAVRQPRLGMASTCCLVAFQNDLLPLRRLMIVCIRVIPPSGLRLGLVDVKFWLGLGGGTAGGRDIWGDHYPKRV